MLRLLAVTLLGASDVWKMAIRRRIAGGLGGGGGVLRVVALLPPRRTGGSSAGALVGYCFGAFGSASTESGSYHPALGASPPPSPTCPEPGATPEFVVIPRSASMEAEEARLGRALVATVGGSRPVVSASQVQQYLLSQHGVSADRCSVHRFHPEDFLVFFKVAADCDRVLLGAPPTSPPFRLVWKRWVRQSMASPLVMRHRVLIILRGLPAHAWSLDVAQRVLGSSCAQLQPTRKTALKQDLSKFVLAAWCVHPDLIPRARTIWVQDPIPPHEPGILHLKPHEVMHTRLDGLMYDVQVELVEVQDWFVRPEPVIHPDNGDSDGSFGEEDDDEDSGGPWPKRSRADVAISESVPSLGPGWGEPFQYGSSKSLCTSLPETGPYA